MSQHVQKLKRYLPFSPRTRKYQKSLSQTTADEARAVRENTTELLRLAKFWFSIAEDEENDDGEDEFLFFDFDKVLKDLKTIRKGVEYDETGEMGYYVLSDLIIGMCKIEGSDGDWFELPRLPNETDEAYYARKKPLELQLLKKKASEDDSSEKMNVVLQEVLKKCDLDSSFSRRFETHSSIQQEEAISLRKLAQICATSCAKQLRWECVKTLQEHGVFPDMRKVVGFWLHDGLGICLQSVWFWTRLPTYLYEMKPDLDSLLQDEYDHFRFQFSPDPTLGTSENLADAFRKFRRDHPERIDRVFQRKRMTMGGTIAVDAKDFWDDEEFRRVYERVHRGVLRADPSPRYVSDYYEYVDKAPNVTLSKELEYMDSSAFTTPVRFLARLAWIVRAQGYASEMERTRATIDSMPALRDLEPRLTGYLFPKDAFRPRKKDEARRLPHRKALYAGRNFYNDDRKKDGAGAGGR